MTVVLKLYTDQSFYFLSPTEPCSDPLPTAIVPPEEQVCISGVLSLRVSLRPRTIKHLSITFDSSFNVLMPMSERKRSKSLQHQYLQLKTNGPQLYPVGEHLFAFTFFVPQSTAPSDESLDVSVRHRLRAKAVATGTFNDKMHEAVLPVRLVGNANALSCEMPEPLLCHVESYSDYLGPYTCELISDSLTVGSMLRIHFNLPGTHDVNILSIRAYVEETICLASAHKGQQSYCLPKKKHRFCQYDYRRSHLLKNGKVPFIGPDTLPSQPGGLRQLLVHAPKGKETRISFVTRLPDCRTMRPTSLECNSRTPLHISTNIGVDVRYRASDGSARVMTVDKKVSIASCTCIAASVTLPLYEERPVSIPKITKSLCACGLPLEELVSASDSVSPSSNLLSSSPDTLSPLSGFGDSSSLIKARSSGFLPHVVRDMLD